jgi:hypothetical protein
MLETEFDFVRFLRGLFLETEKTENQKKKIFFFKMRVEGPGENSILNSKIKKMGEF